MALEANTIIMLAGLGINLVLSAVVGTWKLSRVEISLREAIENARQEVDERISIQAREFGETVAAIRSGFNMEVASLRKEITEDQKFVRDTFMRRDSFYKIQDALQADIKALGAELKSRLERMETKIDSKT